MIFALKMGNLTLIVYKTCTVQDASLEVSKSDLSLF
jgi:hypothetical protein